MRLVYLPAYSPDLNPIELLFSSMKCTIRRNDMLMQRVMEPGDDFAVYAALHDIVWGVSASDAEGWFTKCGYF
ncbi:hypothetical protein CALVIDRAFT_477819 [Calocera viscosa TUFC12733]|uniref:Tc1-like transposase DDE domain-containing protein n=1 Tax=Calocera viscosa (strain TUFC12733) TaxID=1330018 RepID=A0A167PTM7_CALVF|nr:hypothetical protein CALVIDRAFT_477819 [Calocera viscosa TUFC12733]